MMLKDRDPRPVVRYRVAIGRPGTEKTGKGSQPSQLDHFEVTEASISNGKQFVKEAHIHGIIGSNPREVEIFVDSDNIEDFVDAKYESKVIGNNGLVVFCRGDGEWANRRRPGKTWERVPCRATPPKDDGGGYPERTPRDLETILRDPNLDNPGGNDSNWRCPFAQNTDKDLGPVCGPELRMYFRLKDAPTFAAYARYTTHGHRTTDQILRSLEEIKRVTGGLLRGVPLKLVLQRVRMQRRGGKSATHSVVHVELALPPEEAMSATLSFLRRHELAKSEARALIDAGKTQEELEEEEREWPHAADLRSPAAPGPADGAEGPGVGLNLFDEEG